MSVMELTRKAKASNVRFEMVEVTPHIAKSWLDKNTSNRKLSKRFVTQIARDIASGAWRITGDSIKFCSDESLLDGQHRLAGCIAADKPFHTMVIYGLPKETQDVMDVGKSRSASDVLSIKGIKGAANVGTALKILINEKRQLSNVGGVGTCTNAEIVAALGRHPQLPMYVPHPGVIPRGISIGMVGYVSYVGARLISKRATAEAMVAVLKTGVPHYEGDPIHRFRERIIHDYASMIGTPSARLSLFNTFKWAWNKFADEEPVERLRWVEADVAIAGLDLKRL